MLLHIEVEICRLNLCPQHFGKRGAHRIACAPSQCRSRAVSNLTYRGTDQTGALVDTTQYKLLGLLPDGLVGGVPIL